MTRANGTSGQSRGPPARVRPARRRAGRDADGGVGQRTEPEPECAVPVHPVQCGEHLRSAAAARTATNHKMAWAVGRDVSVRRARRVRSSHHCTSSRTTAMGQSRAARSSRSCSSCRSQKRCSGAVGRARGLTVSKSGSPSARVSSSSGASGTNWLSGSAPAPEHLEPPALGCRAGFREEPGLTAAQRPLHAHDPAPPLDQRVEPCAEQGPFLQPAPHRRAMRVVGGERWARRRLGRFHGRSWVRSTVGARRERERGESHHLMRLRMTHASPGESQVIVMRERHGGPVSFLVRASEQPFTVGATSGRYRLSLR
ncbi:hypothetical protein CFP59_00064 [Streptomyces malaysiensis subsp. malaysiensis]|nr:hypothetical protein CFP59_00064 [Streptomyces sp. M56]